MCQALCQVHAFINISPTHHQPFKCLSMPYYMQYSVLWDYEDHKEQGVNPSFKDSTKQCIRHDIYRSNCNT